jgi:GNAT superfamily N-acetyltransferase
VEADDFLLRALQADDQVGSMKSGDDRFAQLSQFVRKHAKKYEAKNLARTYVVQDLSNGRIAAYVTLVCSEIESNEPLIVDEEIDFPYEHYPAVKIARLLVDKRYRGENSAGLGRTLVDFALGVARTEVCPAIGCRFVVVDSKQDSVGFYQKCGFTPVGTLANMQRPEPVMFIDLHKAAPAN